MVADDLFFCDIADRKVCGAGRSNNKKGLSIVNPNSLKCARDNDLWLSRTSGMCR